MVFDVDAALTKTGSGVGAEVGVELSVWDREGTELKRKIKTTLEDMNILTAQFLKNIFTMITSIFGQYFNSGDSPNAMGRLPYVRSCDV